MTRRDFLQRSARLGVGALGVGLTACAAPGVASRQPIYTWRMASSWPTTLPLLHEAAVDFADTVSALTAGQFRIEVIDPGRHGRPAGLLKAVQAGEFEMAHTTAQYYADQVPAIDFFTAVPFGLLAVEQEGWLAEGGGQTLFESVLATRGVFPLTAGHTGVQMGGWFKRELNRPEDLRGMRVRVAGFPGRVLARLGAIPVNLPLGQIAPAFVEGRIDAADVVGPAIDATLPLARFAPHYYAPWHEPDVAMHVFIDREKFLTLSAQLQQVIRQSAQAAAMRSMARAHDRNAVAWRELLTRGTQVKPLPKSVLEALRAATEAEMQVSSAADAESKQVLESLQAYKARVAPYSLQADVMALGVR